MKTITRDRRGALKALAARGCELSGKLVGYGAFGGKALFEQWSCGVDRKDFDDQGCAGVSCRLPDAATPASGDAGVSTDSQ